MHLACNSGATELARSLWMDNAPLDVVDGRGHTPMTCLLRHRFKATQQMKLFKELIVARPHRW